jgi:hypothetical protein
MSPASAERNASTVRVLLQCDRDDVLDALADTGVDDLEAGVAQRPGDDLGASIMAVQTGFRHEHSRGH